MDDALAAALSGATRLDEHAVLALGDALEVLETLPERSIHAVVTDPPYSNLEYAADNHAKLRAGKGGVWRIPPVLDGVQRRPLPRFTVLDDRDHAAMDAFFEALARALLRVLVPGGHVLLASNPIVCDSAFPPFRRAGFEKRGVVVRTVRTLRGGDRPKGAHERYPDLSVMPRSAQEPWGLFRKPLEGTVVANLERWGAGALRRPERDSPFTDLIACAPARGAERKLSEHPSLKPQRFLRQVVRAVLPLGQGVVLDPFAGSGSTVAAASHLGLQAVGIERDPTYHAAAVRSFPGLRDLRIPS
ncbi:MAG: site-specific DNA-methyltransferase [Myxococcales bacterium]|nr:site-specific DNA-methyltransferase [Myxococcales bacterium]